MKFVMGDLFGAGGIGLIYYTTGGYILAHIIFFAVVILAIIGLITTIKWLFSRRGKKMDPHEKWLKTGRMD